MGKMSKDDTARCLPDLYSARRKQKQVQHAATYCYTPSFCTRLGTPQTETGATRRNMLQYTATHLVRRKWKQFSIFVCIYT